MYVFSSLALPTFGTLFIRTKELVVALILYIRITHAELAFEAYTDSFYRFRSEDLW
jgi:hypothetical protein